MAGEKLISTIFRLNHKEGASRQWLASFDRPRKKSCTENVNPFLVLHTFSERNNERKNFMSCYRLGHKVPFAYVDGSFNVNNGKYGYGIVLVTDKKSLNFSGSGCDKEMAQMRNVAGEIEGAKRAITEAVKLKLRNITIYYDYLGIEKWATGEWKRNKPATIAYHEFVKSAPIRIDFVKVKAHSNVELNEMVDRMAKWEVGNI